MPLNDCHQQYEATECPLTPEAFAELLRTTLGKGLDFTFVARGWSMFPFIRDKDVVTISSLPQNEVQIGNVVACLSPESSLLVVHRLVKKTPCSYFLKGDAVFKCDLPVQEGIVGVVTRVSRKGKEVRFGSGMGGTIIVFLNRFHLFPGFFRCAGLLKRVFSFTGYGRGQTNMKDRVPAPAEQIVRYIMQRIIGADGPVPPFDEPDYTLLSSQAVVSLLEYHELSPYLYPIFKDREDAIPSALIASWRNNHYCAAVRCQLFWDEFLRIHAAFSAKGILIVPLKGISLLHDVYDALPVRLMNDIDILVKDDDLTAAMAVLTELGYHKVLFSLREEYWRNSQCHLTFESEASPARVELHWDIDLKRRGKRVVDTLWQRLRVMEKDGHSLQVLSCEDTFLSLVLHLRRFGKTLCLKNVIDFLLLFQKYGRTFSWEYVVTAAMRFRLTNSVFYFLSLAESAAPGTIPHEVFTRLNTSSRRKAATARFIGRNVFSPAELRQTRRIYLAAHFLLYDTLREPLKYVLNIPIEQFAKFYNLSPYKRKTLCAYRCRYLYVPLRFLVDYVTAGLGRKNDHVRVGEMVTSCSDRETAV